MIKHTQRSDTLSNILHRFLFVTVFFLLIVFAGKKPAYAAKKDPQVLKNATRLSATSYKIVKKNKKLILKKSGKAVTLKNYWFRYKDHYYYINKKGYIQTGAFKYQGFSYRARSSGSLYVSYLYDSGSHYYYYGKTGAMVTSEWVTLSSGKRYFLKNGRMACNQWVGTYFVDWNGKIVSGLTRKKGSGNSYKEVSVVSNSDHLIVIGASRVVDMKEAVAASSTYSYYSSYVTYIAADGKRLSWFKASALPMLKVYMKMYPKSTIVVQLGNNDLSKGSSFYHNYWNAYKKLLKTYPNNKIYFMDILPADASTKRERNQKAAAFNSQLKSRFPSNYIGAFNYLMSVGYTTTDGIHYNAQTSLTIFDYILRQIGWISRSYIN